MAPFDVRIRNVMNELRCSEARAHAHIVELGKEHREFVKAYFNADIHDTARFHLVVNTALVEPESIVRIVKGMIEAIA
jgi:cytidylate kinase